MTYIELNQLWRESIPFWSHVSRVGLKEHNSDKAITFASNPLTSPLSATINGPKERNPNRLTIIVGNGGELEYQINPAFEELLEDLVAALSAGEFDLANRILIDIDL